MGSRRRLAWTAQASAAPSEPGGDFTQPSSSGGQSTQCDVRALPEINSTTRHCIGLDVVGKKGYPQRREYPCRGRARGFKQILYARPEQRPNNPTMLSMIMLRSEDAAPLSGLLDAKNQSGENSPEGRAHESCGR